MVGSFVTLVSPSWDTFHKSTIKKQLTVNPHLTVLSLSQVAERPFNRASGHHDHGQIRPSPDPASNLGRTHTEGSLLPPPPPRSHKEEKALVDVQNAFNKGGRLARFSTYLDKRVLWSGIQGALPSTKAPLMLKRLPGFRFLALRGLLRRTAGRTARSSCGDRPQSPPEKKEEKKTVIFGLLELGVPLQLVT
jgi:hypothetical protein